MAADNFKLSCVRILYPVLGNISKMDTPFLDQESQNHDSVGRHIYPYRYCGGVPTPPGTIDCSFMRTFRQLS